MTTFGKYEIQEHPSSVFGRLRWSLDCRVNAGDRVRLDNIGWYASYEDALRAMSARRQAA